MAELIDPLADCLEDPDASMDIRRSDYDDPGRWWL
jgi:iron uptake system EfeUOB component EfeO/EfeM